MGSSIQKTPLGKGARDKVMIEGPCENARAYGAI